LKASLYLFIVLVILITFSLGIYTIPVNIYQDDTSGKRARQIKMSTELCRDREEHSEWVRYRGEADRDQWLAIKNNHKEYREKHPSGARKPLDAGPISGQTRHCPVLEHTGEGQV
jgi:hypothetical protein